MADFMALRASLRAAEASMTHALYQRGLAANPPKQTAVAKTQQAVRLSKSTLNAALAASVQPGTDTAGNLQGDVPVALFPMRLETRFVRSGGAAPDGGRVVHRPPSP